MLQNYRRRGQNGADNARCGKGNQVGPELLPPATSKATFFILPMKLSWPPNIGFCSCTRVLVVSFRVSLESFGEDFIQSNPRVPNTARLVPTILWPRCEL